MNQFIPRKWVNPTMLANAIHTYGDWFLQVWPFGWLLAKRLTDEEEALMAANPAKAFQEIRAEMRW